MIIVRTIIIVIALCWVYNSIAQVSVNAEVILQGPTNADRQVTGLAPSTNYTDALNANYEQGGTLRKATSITNDWNVQVVGLYGAPVPGTQLMLSTPVNSTGNVSLMVNGSGPYALLYAPNDTAVGGEFQTEVLLSVVFDGNSFQIMNGPSRTLRSCPSGTVAVSDQYCIASDFSSATSVTFFEAVTECNSQGLRLCSWGEWYVACTQKDQLGIIGMNSTWEWTNDSANEDGNARWAGYQQCTTSNTGPVLTPAKYRCCFTR